MGMDAEHRPIGLFISDVDGTLVRSDKRLADETVAAVERLKAAGLPMTIISARPPSGLYWIADRLDLPGPFGAFNGGTLFMRDRRVIERHGLSGAVAKIAIDRLMAAELTCWVFADGQWMASNDSDPHTGSEIVSANQQPVVTSDFTPWIDRIDKVVGVSDDHAGLAALEAELIESIGAEATIARSQPYYLDVTAPQANKGDGVSFLARAFDVPIDRVAVIGDQANDLPMFARAGYAIAMGQGPQHVQAKADVVTLANDSHGVAHAIDMLILPRLT